jgi:hypothetical protein
MFTAKITAIGVVPAEKQACVKPIRLQRGNGPAYHRICDRAEMRPSASRRSEKRGSAVKMKRIFGGSLTALLLCVSSWAAACDLSCGFAQFQSDCHSPRMAVKESMPAEMTMPGMAMPEMAGASSTNQQMFSHSSQAIPAHAAFVDMGACERQSCDQVQTLAAKGNHPTAAPLDTIRAVAGFSRIHSAKTAFHDARDDLAPLSPAIHSPLSVSLRI